MEENAWVLHPQEAVLVSGTWGDGIEHVQVDDVGDLWVGYVDEGVYGNLGWGRPAPLGAPGIVRWSSTVERLWDYPRDAPVIDECSTMDVVGTVAWACTYSEIP